MEQETPITRRQLRERRESPKPEPEPETRDKEEQEPVQQDKLLPSDIVAIIALLGVFFGETVCMISVSVLFVWAFWSVAKCVFTHMCAALSPSTQTAATQE